jgi:hypothetical protein
VKATLRDPVGQLVLDAQVGNVLFEEGKSVSTGLKGRHFAVPCFGTYKVEVTAGQKVFPCEFEIVANTTRTSNVAPTGTAETIRKKFLK